MVNTQLLRKHFEEHPNDWFTTDELVTMLGGQNTSSEVADETRRMISETRDEIYNVVRERWNTVTERPEIDGESFKNTLHMTPSDWQSVVVCEMDVAQESEGHARQEHAERATLALTQFAASL